MLFGKRLVMKLFRRFEPGPNPDVEIGEYLAERRFPRVPPLVGSISYTAGPEGLRPDLASLAMLQEYVYEPGATGGRSRSTSWAAISSASRRCRCRWMPRRNRRRTGHSAAIADAPGVGRRSDSRVSGHRGDSGTPDRRTARDAGGKHHEPGIRARAADERGSGADDQAMRRRAEEHLNLLETVLPRLDDRVRREARQVLDHREALLQQFEELRGVSGVVVAHPVPRRLPPRAGARHGRRRDDPRLRRRAHAPHRRTADEKCSPLRDVAGMLRSFSYAALTAIGAATRDAPRGCEAARAVGRVAGRRWVGATRSCARISSATREAAFLPPPRDLEVLLRAYVLDKTLYELAYELNNRPAAAHPARRRDAASAAPRRRDTLRTPRVRLELPSQKRARPRRCFVGARRGRMNNG